MSLSLSIYIYIYIYVCVYIYIYIYIFLFKQHILTLEKQISEQKDFRQTSNTNLCFDEDPWFVDWLGFDWLNFKLPFCLLRRQLCMVRDL